MVDIAREAWEFAIVCVPIVVIGAPIGAFLGSHFHRLVLATAVVIVTVGSLISAYAIVVMTQDLIIITICILLCGVTIFGLLSYAGHRIVVRLREEEQAPVLKKALQGVTVIEAPGGVVNDGYSSKNTSETEISRF